MIHELKILPQYFEAVQAGLKNFEIRQDNRGFTEGDTLILKEWNTGYTGREIDKEISYILKGGQYGLEEGYCIASLKQEGIVLKNIDLTGIPPIEQARKVEEERQEFIYAFDDYKNNKNKENKIHVMDELLDEFQTKLGLLEKEGIKAEEVQAYYHTWVKKLDKRPRKKLCSKCINCEIEEYTDDRKVMICRQDGYPTATIADEYAKECKCYEESED